MLMSEELLGSCFSDQGTEDRKHYEAICQPVYNNLKHVSISSLENRKRLIISERPTYQTELL